MDCHSIIHIHICTAAQVSLDRHPPALSQQPPNQPGDLTAYISFSSTSRTPCTNTFTSSLLQVSARSSLSAPRNSTPPNSHISFICLLSVSRSSAARTCFARQQRYMHSSSMELTARLTTSRYRATAARRDKVGPRRRERR